MRVITTAGAIKTTMAPDWATTEIADIAAAEAAGTSSKVPRADHVHKLPDGLLTLPMFADGVAAVSYTPVLSGAGTAGTFTYVIQKGRYARLGPLVFVEFTINVSAASVAPVGNMQISLPVTAFNDTNLFGGCAMESSNADWSAGYTYMTGRVSPNSSQLTLLIHGDNVSSINFTGAMMDYPVQFLGGLMYFAA